MSSQRRLVPQNRLLAALPRSDAQRLQGAGEEVNLEFGELLYEAAARIRHAYFPTDGVVSLMLPVADTGTLEIGLVGNEGMVGAPLILGVTESPLRAQVQGGGSAWRVSAARFMAELARSTSLRRALHRYVQVRMNQLSQAAACTRFHVVEERLARWLLMTQDRAHRDQLHVTHEYLAHMLGVRRVGITKAANALQKRQLIRYRRGNVTILDRAGMEAVSCGCYRADLAIYDGLLPA